MPYQAEWCGDPESIKIIEKSRRIGISWAEAADSVVEAAAADGCDVWYVGYNKDMAVEFIRDCAFWSRIIHGLVVEVTQGEWGNVEKGLFDDKDPDRSILIFTIRYASGYRITALSSRPTNLRNKRGRIIIDEAAFHPDLRGLLKSALAVKMWGGRSKVIIISTHNGTECDYYKILEEVKAGKRPYSHHKVTLDDALEQGLYKRICLMNGWEWSVKAQADWRKQLFDEYGDDANEELLCIPARSGGVYLARTLIEKQMRPGEVYRMTLEDSFMGLSEPVRKQFITNWCAANLRTALARWPRADMKGSFVGQDFGRVSDRSVIAPGYLTQKMVRKFPFAVEMLNVPHEQQAFVLFYIMDYLLDRSLMGAVIDSTGNGSWLGEQAVLRYGEQVVERVAITEKWYAENLPPLKAGLEDELVELVRDADHAIDLGHFQTINGIPKLPKAKTKTSTGEGPKRHGDAGIAYVCAHRASRQPPREYSYTKASPGEHERDEDSMPNTRKSSIAYTPKRRSGGMF